jgi:glycosyltransferase involved in cell wall biosynthesis
MASPYNRRNAFADHRHVDSELRDERGVLAAPPVVTIGIPTFRRIDTLVEAIGSALNQKTSTPFEVLVVDNDPSTVKWPTVGEALGPGPHARLRYYVNASNTGMFGNWNRCIELAEGEWVTILNDDDLLRPDFIARSLAILSTIPRAEGLLCRKGVRDRRTEAQGRLGVRSARVSERALAATAGLVRHLKSRNGARLVHPRQLFFGNELGNGAGFLFRRNTALGLGGYDPEDGPAADFLFYVRMALADQLYFFRETLAEVGLGDNESMERETLLAFITTLQEVREQLAGLAVPREWLRMSPQLVANHLRSVQLNWDPAIGAADVEPRVGFALPPPSFARETMMRLIRRAI